ncbi:MAG TPA: lysophospholipid acyltransferase family protein [Thermoanaerobaculia bacterium]|nr:lysophospholipid acyltransferase family protein [Thermoanaerobaculia bacterium]
MARRVIAAALRLLLRVFFRRIEVVGDVPRDPVIFAINHPNALIDPLFLLCFAPRPVSFLAKAPLFRMPVIGWFTRALDAIPVYRRQDNVSTAGNRETFARSREVLQRGGAIAIFPEGTTHSDPQLRELKTGAARIALGAAIRVSIVPAGLYYTAKQTFRSSALVYFGTPIAVEPEPVDANGEPRPDSVERLTKEIEEALAAVTLQADSHSALELIARAERIFTAGEDVALARELELRKQFVAGYAYLRERDPGRLTRLESMIQEVDAERLVPRARIAPQRLALVPFGVIGAAIHWPVYRLIGFLATHLSSREDEMVATVKAIAGAVLYPLMWIALAIATGLLAGVWWALFVLVALPLLGYAALVSLEALDDLRARVRRRDIAAQQQAIRDEVLSVAKSMSQSSSAGAAVEG